MSLTQSFLVPTCSELKRDNLPSAEAHHNKRQFLAGVLVCAALASSIRPGVAQPLPHGKKLIEYGWDVPTPAQMRDELAVMEKRPFDGLIFRLGAGHNAFVTNALDNAKFAEDESILRGLQFEQFKNNFVLVWGSPPPGFNWFDDAQWSTIEANAKVLVGIAQAGRVRYLF
jgi:hypothetical protein